MKMNLQQYLNKIAAAILWPIRKAFPQLFAYTLMLVVTEVIGIIIRDEMHHACLHRLPAAAFLFALPYMLCLLGEILGILSRWLRTTWHILIHIVLGVLTMGEIFMMLFYTSRYTAIIFQLLGETNMQEASEFISVYVFSWKFFGIVCLLGIILLVEYFLIIKQNQGEWWRNYSWASTVGACLILAILSLSIPEFAQFRHEKAKTIDNQNDCICLWNFYQAADLFSESMRDIDVCLEVQRNLRIDSCDYLSPNIIVCIGESYDKHHSSLYGYPLRTNPLLEHDSLYIFQDVITPINSTTFAFRNFMSLTSADDTLRRWCDSPLFPAVFKAAGYNTVFYSNQFVVEPKTDMFDFQCGFYLDNPKLQPYEFCYRNTVKFPYDGELIDQWESEDRTEMEADSNNLIIFHFMGQHVDACARYPKKWDYFSSDSIQRSELSESEKMEVAAYDNATRYNDWVVHRIIELYKDKDAIVVYFPDHGDEANDFRPCIGRAFNYATGDGACAHCQLDIPLLIYVSPLYCSLHPEMVSRIEGAVQQPFMTDDIPHLLLDLAGIHTTWFSPERSPINEAYKPRERVVMGFNYDSFFRELGTLDFKIGYIKKRN